MSKTEVDSIIFRGFNWLSKKGGLLPVKGVMAFRPQMCGLEAILIFFVERLGYELYFPYLTFKIGLKLNF